LPIDDRILEALSDSKMILSPAVMAINIDKSRDEVNRRLSALADHGVIDRVKRGYYEINEKGEAYLEGQLQSDDLKDLD